MKRKRKNNIEIEDVAVRECAGRAQTLSAASKTRKPPLPSLTPLFLLRPLSPLRPPKKTMICCSARTRNDIAAPNDYTKEGGERTRCGGGIDLGGRAGDRGMGLLGKKEKSCCRRRLLSGAGSRVEQGSPPPCPRRRMIRVLQPHIITATTIINISRWNMRNLLLHLSWKEYIVDQAGLKLAFRAIFYALLHVSCVTRVLS